MCGIAGVVDLTDRRPVPPGVIGAMAEAIVHRGPDEDGFLERPGLALASRRLSIVGLADGRQPIANEDRSVWVVFNGELFDYREMRPRLESRGHRFRTHCDTELIPHLWEEHGEGMFDHLRGQFAFALWDERRRCLILGRDRFGICPLHWTRQAGPDGEWLLFSSEIKPLLGSGMVKVAPNLRGLNHLFTFFSQPGPVTCFEGIEALRPGHFVRIQLGGPADVTRVSERVYWQVDFPDHGQEERGRDTKSVLDGFEEVLLRSTEKRLRADVPVVSYLSGGVDSSAVVALACRVLGRPIPTFTIRIEDPALDETSGATLTARHVGTEPIIVPCGANEVLDNYPRLILAAESPVIDTSCTALMLLAQEVHARGYKVALTGEGSDEWLAGYPWYKIHKLLGFADVIPGLRLSPLLRRAYAALAGVPSDPVRMRRVLEAVGGPNAWLEIYGLMSLSRERFFTPALKDALRDHIPYADLEPNLERARRWHPLNRSLYYGILIHLPGLLLNAKGDRVAMHSSVETRYPFLDEDVFAYLAKLHPSWKLHGFREKHILRLLAERWLPKTIARRRKAMFRAPFDSFHLDRAPGFVGQLISEESLRKAGYFDPQAVRHWGQAFRSMRPGSPARLTLEMGLVGVVATQMWHHTFLDPSLADLPAWTGARRLGSSGPRNSTTAGENGHPFGAGLRTTG